MRKAGMDSPADTLLNILLSSLLLLMVGVGSFKCVIGKSLDSFVRWK